MFIRMNQYCDKVVILKSVSTAFEAFDASGVPIKGLRKSTTVQIASFNLDEPISHPEIPTEKAKEFESWRAAQISRIHAAFVENAAAGRLGGFPLLKTKSDFGSKHHKVGEFSGVIDHVISVDTEALKGLRVSDAPKSIAGETLADRASCEAVIERMHAIAEDILRFIAISGKKGTDLFTLQQNLDMRAAWYTLGCSLDSRGIGYKKITGEIEGRNAANEGLEIFNEIKKNIQ